MLAIYALSILVREITPDLARNVAWAEEATRYLLVWLVFLALGLALAEGRQIAMNTFLLGFPDRVRLILQKIIDATGLLFCAYITWVGSGLAQMVANTGQLSPTLGISAGWLYLALPVGFLLLALRYGLSLFGVIDRWSRAAEAQIH